MNKFLFNLKYNEPLGKNFPKYAISQSEYTRLNSEDSAVAWAKNTTEIGHNNIVISTVIILLREVR